MGDARGLNSVIFWVHWYQWGDATDIGRGEGAETKKLGTLDLNHTFHDHEQSLS
jgi:hypothetical protein